MSDSRESNGGLLGLFGVSMVVCCGLPVLLGTGIAIGAAGLALRQRPGRRRRHRRRRVGVATPLATLQRSWPGPSV